MSFERNAGVRTLLSSKWWVLRSKGSERGRGRKKSPYTMGPRTGPRPASSIPSAHGRPGFRGLLASLESGFGVGRRVAGIGE